MIFRLVVFFSLLPNFGIAIFPSDTQPLAFLFAISGLLFFRRRQMVNKITLPFISMAIIASVSGMISLVMGYHSVVDLIRSYFGYISPPIILLYLIPQIKQTPPSVLIKVCDVSLIFVFVGIFLQYIGLSNLISVFVNRAVFEDIETSSRGYTSFFSEQSRVSIQMTVFFGAYLLTKSLNWPRVIALLLVSALSFAGQFIIMLGIILVSFLLMQLVSALKKPSQIFKALKRVILIIPLVIILFNEKTLNYLENWGFPIRGFTRAFSLVTVGADFIANDRGVLIKLSGIFYAICALLVTPFNFLIGSTAQPEYVGRFSRLYGQLSKALFGNDFVYTGKNVFSAFGTWIVDFGLIGFSHFLLIHIFLLKKIDLDKTNGKNVLLMYFVWSVMTAFPTALANPSLWLLLSLIIVYSTDRNLIPQLEGANRGIQTMINNK